MPEHPDEYRISVRKVTQSYISVHIRDPKYSDAVQRYLAEFGTAHVNVLDNRIISLELLDFFDSDDVISRIRQVDLDALYEREQERRWTLGKLIRLFRMWW